MKKHAVFFGSYDLTLDSKHRMLIHSEVRSCIVPERDGEAFFAIVGLNQKIWLLTESAYADQAEQPLDMIPGEDEMAFNQLWYGMTSKLAPDSQGRVLLPEKFLVKTKTGREVVLVGMRDHLEIWNRTDWAAREIELEAQRMEIAERIKKSRQLPSRE